MKKLLIISSNTIHVYNYIRLIEQDFDEILLLSNAIHPDFKHRTEVLSFSLKNPIQALKTVRRIKAITQAFRPDIIHVHQANSYAFLSFWAVSGYEIPRVLTAWGSDILLLPKKNFLMKAMVRYVLKMANGITADAHFVADEIRSLLNNPRQEVLIANFGIQLQTIHTSKENIIYSNRLHKKLYRIDQIIRGFHRFIQDKTFNDWKLIVAATGEETEALRQLAQSLKIDHRVDFAGWVNKEQNALFYGRAKIFVSIPESDATSISLLEAMASGCLPVLSDLPANNQWVKHGENGYIVRDLQTNFFAEALKLDFDRAHEINQNLVNDHGTMQANRTKFLKLYAQLLKK